MSVRFQASWLDDKVKGRHHRMWLTLTDDGRVFAGEHTVNGTAPCAPREEKKPCRTCSGAHGVRWLGLVWLGVPLPVRLWRRLFYLDRPEDWKGCGCVAVLKALWLAVATVPKLFARYRDSLRMEARHG